MRQPCRGIIACFTALFAWVHAAHAIDLTDERGRSVHLDVPAQRIVTLAPHLAEIVHAAGAGEKLVAVARHSDYPAVVRLLPVIGDAAQIDAERILALRPDLVLAWKSGNPPRGVERLERIGLRVFVTEPSRLDDVPRLLRSVGALAGTLQAASREANKFINKINILRSTYEGKPAVRVYYEIWHRPPMTVSGHHMISDVISLCGGVNVFAEAAQLTPTVSAEAMLAARPEVVIGGSSVSTPQAFAAQWRRHPIAALRDLPVHYVPPDLIQRATPRMADGAQAVCEALDRVRAQRDRQQVRRGSDAGK